LLGRREFVVGECAAVMQLVELLKLFGDRGLSR
jgi:hypothetical protein